MGSIGGLLGLSGGQGGTGFNTPSGTDSGQLQTAYTNANNAVGNQTQVYNQLQNIAAGQGPNPAQAQLNQATATNVANQGALQAGQRGAAQNVGLIARQAGQQGMQAQQQAAGQGASMEAQQALGALGQAGQMATGITAAQQGEQNILQTANSANNNINGQLANTTLTGQQNMMGGVMNGIGSAVGLAQGGQVPRFAAGGATGFNTMAGAAAQPIQTAGPQSAFAQSLAASAGTPTFSQGQSKPMFTSNKKPKTDPMAQANAGLPQAQQQFASMVDPTQDSGEGLGMSGMGDSAGSSMGMGDSMRAAQGGNVGSKLKQGGHVPGKAKVKGNSYSNDTVKALLSPGEVVIPKSVMESGDPARGAAQFVQAIMAKKRKKA